MNSLAIDYGQKNIGFAISVNGIISPIKSAKNDQNLIKIIKSIINEYQVDKVFVGISYGRFGNQTKTFLKKLKNMLDLPVEGVEETVSTIEANQIFINNNKSKKKFDSLIDSISAAVILRRALGQS